MAQARGYEPKTVLAPEEKLRVAYWHLIGGFAQHDLAALFHLNAGRVSEAVTEVRKALGWSNGGEQQ